MLATDRRVDMAADGDGAHGHCGIRQALCHCYDIGRDAQDTLNAALADAKAGFHLINDQQHAEYPGDRYRFFTQGRHIHVTQLQQDAIRQVRIPGCEW